MKIAVMMSTYNGGLYLEQQLNSILKQNIDSIDIYIRDDGSDDSTLNILNKYYKEGKIRSLLLGKNIGYSKSFYEIMNSVPNDYDYYAFSDQDDYWLNDKLSSGIQKLTINSSSFYYSSLTFVDKDLNSLFKKNFFNKLTFPSIFSRSPFAGCTMIFDNFMLSLVKHYDNLNFLTYDNFMVIIASINGLEIVYDRDSKILHRVHSNNATIRVENLYLKFFKRLKEINRLKLKRELITKELLNLPEISSNSKIKTFLLLYKNYKTSISKKFSLLFYYELSTNLILIDFINRILILFNCY
jgi:glycosyltransferase involved in cell wall biosynthesis